MSQQQPTTTQSRPTTNPSSPPPASSVAPVYAKRFEVSFPIESRKWFFGLLAVVWMLNAVLSAGGLVVLTHETIEKAISHFIGLEVAITQFLPVKGFIFLVGFCLSIGFTQVEKRIFRKLILGRWRDLLSTGSVLLIVLCIAYDYGSTVYGLADFIGVSPGKISGGLLFVLLLGIPVTFGVEAFWELPRWTYSKVNTQ